MAVDKMLERLHAGGLTLLVEREGRLVHASDRAGLRPLYEGVIEHPQLFEGADVADRVVGLAAAYLLVHAHAARVATPVITRDAEKALAEAGIPFSAQSRVKHIEDVPLPDGVGVEQLAHDSVTPATFVEALRSRFG
jgi:iron complex outermembrane receptor protein